MSERKSEIVMDAAAVDECITRMALTIMEARPGAHGLGLVGVRTRGAPLASRLAAALRRAADAEVPVGILDINLYRDDLSTIADHPVLRKTEIPFQVEGRRVILVDDVLFTGRTVRAALDAIIDLGRPESIRLAVLVDRGGRELPIRADFVGRTLETTADQEVRVELSEVDGHDRVTLLGGGER